MALMTLDGMVSTAITATITATWNTNHYDFTVAGDEEGIVGISACFLCEYQGTIEINDKQIVLDDTVTLQKLGVDLSRQCLLCKIERISE